MQNKEKLKRILCCVFTVLLLLIVVIEPTAIRAQAAAVTGVAIGVVGAVAGALAAWGIGTAANNMTTGGVSDFFSSSLQTWANSVGETLETLIPAAAISISPTGAMILNNTAVLGVRAYATWLQQQNNLTDGGPLVTIYQNTNQSQVPMIADVDVATADIINQQGLYTLYSYGTRFKVVSSVGGIVYTAFYYLPNSGKYRELFVCSSSGQKVRTASLNQYNNALLRSPIQLTNVYDGIYYAVEESSMDTFFNEYLVSQIPIYNSFAEAIAGLKVQQPSSSLDLVPSDVIGIPSIEDISDESYVVDYGGTAGLTVDQAAQEILEKVVENDLTSSGEVEQEQTNVTWPDITRPVAVVGLQNVFPFCIPFDIVDFLRVMNATREAPEIDWPINIPSLNFSYTIEIDLSGFNQIASILRTMELLLFIVGLAFVTRSMIIRG